jgi:protein gp37
MAEKTKIAWTDHTFNPTWGCTKVSPGCLNCYAELLAHRFGYNVWGPNAERRIFGDKHWREPLIWDTQAAEEGKRHHVFCGSMCDAFEDHPAINGERERLFQIIRQAPNLDWLLLTKRAERIAQSLPADWGSGYSNVWLGVTIECNQYSYRADFLRKIPAVVRFISYEPAIGPLEMDLNGIDWLIYGGESGPKFRKDNPEWTRKIRIQCDAAGTAFFFKQSAGLHPGRHNGIVGEIVRNFPKPHVSKDFKRENAELYWASLLSDVPLSVNDDFTPDQDMPIDIFEKTRP